jgi:hypothetical protein
MMEPLRPADAAELFVERAARVGATAELNPDVIARHLPALGPPAAAGPGARRARGPVRAGQGRAADRSPDASCAGSLVAASRPRCLPNERVVGPATGRELVEEARARLRSVGEAFHLCTMLSAVGYLAIVRAEYADAAELLDQALGIERRVGSRCRWR